MITLNLPHLLIIGGVVFLVLKIVVPIVEFFQ